MLRSGLPSRNGWFPRPAVFRSRRRATPGSVPWVAASVQRPGQPLRSQVQSQRFGLRGGAGAQGSGRDSLLHRVLGHVYQWSLPGRRLTPRPLMFFCHWRVYFFFFFLCIYCGKSQKAKILNCRLTILWERRPVRSSVCQCFNICTVFLDPTRNFSETKTCDLDQLLLRKSKKCIFQRTLAYQWVGSSHRLLGELEHKYAEHFKKIWQM